jgi:hypothetical protein
MFNKVHFDSFRYELGKISVVFLILRRQYDTCDSCALGLNTNNTIALKHLAIITEQRLLLADNTLATVPNNCIDLHQGGRLSSTNPGKKFNSWGMNLQLSYSSSHQYFVTDIKTKTRTAT